MEYHRKHFLKALLIDVQGIIPRNCGGLHSRLRVALGDLDDDSFQAGPQAEVSTLKDRARSAFESGDLIAALVYPSSIASKG